MQRDVEEGREDVGVRDIMRRGTNIAHKENSNSNPTQRKKCCYPRGLQRRLESQDICSHNDDSASGIIYRAEARTDLGESMASWQQFGVCESECLPQQS